MKEIDYIRATNLAKIRSANNLLRDCVTNEEPGGDYGLEHNDRAQVLRMIIKWDEKLSELVQVEE